MNTAATYRDTIAYLYERLPMFSNLGKAAIKADLVNILKLCDALGNPQERLKCIHIAGTNGKGSTSHALSAVLQASGYKTGLYTSPHLIDFRERIRINGEPVGKEWVVDFVEKNKALIEEIQPSFFEVTVAMAFVYFAEEQVDYAVIETGLGGRLDSTNIITPILSIITNISYDHKDVLGDTLPKIAAEKAGIIKKQVPVLIGEQHNETERVFFEHAVRNRSTAYYAQALWDLVRTGQDSKYQYFKVIHKARREMYDLQTDLLGTYQQHNIKTVLAACDLLDNRGLHLPLDICLKALGRVKQLTGLRGRWEWIQKHPIIIADVGHNAAGIKEVMQQWELLPADNKYVVTGFVKDKDISEALSFFSKDSFYYFCNAKLPRALPATDLATMAQQQGLAGIVCGSVADAVNAARQKMKEGDALLITGSFFIVGEALEHLNDAVVRQK